MCSIAKLFNVNIRKFDAKNSFCPECLGCVNHKEKRGVFEPHPPTPTFWGVFEVFEKNGGVWGGGVQIFFPKKI